MSAQPTPAPWHAAPVTDKYGHIESYWMVRAGAVQIADLFSLTGEQDEDGCDEYLPDDVARANARLIAAAPELLKALRSVAYIVERRERPPSETYATVLDIVHAALAAAE